MLPLEPRFLQKPDLAISPARLFPTRSVLASFVVAKDSIGSLCNAVQHQLVELAESATAACTVMGCPRS